MVAAKICIKCGEDCSGRPRVKDASGRYACAACVRAAPAPPVESDIDLAPLDISRTRRAPCPKCGGAMRAGEPACPGCGHDPTTVPLQPDKAREVLGDYDADPTSPPLKKKPVKKEREAVFPCKGCGYALKGLKRNRMGEVTCPECGAVDRPLSRGEHDDEVSRDVERWAYRQPLLMLGIGVAGLALVLTAEGWIVGGTTAAISGPRRAGGGWDKSLISLGVGFAVLAWSTVVAIVVTLLAGIMWTGTSTTLRLLALQVVGLQAAGWCLYRTLGLIPIPIPWWAIVALCGLLYAWYLSEMQDLYMQDAAIITFFTGLAVIGSVLGVALMF